MYRKQVRRRRAVLVLLVVACLMLISISISEAEDGPLRSVQEGIGSVLSPIEDGASRALKPVRDMINWFDETFDARGENDRLASENAALSERVLELEQGFEKAGYEKQLAKMSEKSGFDGFQRVDAGILTRSFSSWYETIKIDVGSDDGLGENDAVVTADGLVGRIESLSGGEARVILITDPTSAVTARVSPQGPQGLIEAIAGSPEELDLGLVQGGSDDEIEDGDKLVTAGFNDQQYSSRYPADIPIGEVSETIPGEDDQGQTIRVEPFADLADLDQVTVLTGGDS